MEKTWLTDILRLKNKILRDFISWGGILNMDSLNKYLFAVLSALLVVGGIGSVLASSDDGYGVIEMVDDDSVEDSDDVI